MHILDKSVSKNLKLVSRVVAAKELADCVINDGIADLASFDESFFSNTDIVNRFQTNLELQKPNINTFYTAGPEGYSDYVSIGTH